MSTFVYFGPLILLLGQQEGHLTLQQHTKLVDL